VSGDKPTTVVDWGGNMYRVHRLASAAYPALLVLVLLIFSLGSGANASAEDLSASADSGVSLTQGLSAGVTVVKELPEKRTENSKTYLLSSGALRAEVYAGPIHYQDASGAWKDIDTTLVPGATKGEYVSAATPVEVHTYPAGSPSLVNLKTDGATVGISLVSDKLIDPQIYDNRAFYLAPSSGFALSHEVQDSGVEETVTLYSSKAPGTFTFTVDHPGLTLWQDGTGQWGLYQGVENSPVLVMGGLTVFDSSVDLTGDPAFCSGATMKVVPGKDKSTITITVLQKWLSDPARVYPVVIDPSWATPQASADTWVTDYHPNESYGSYDHLRSGYASLAGNCRSFARFTLPEDIVGGYVQWSQLQLYQWYQGLSGAQPVRVAEMTKDWSEVSTYNLVGSYSLANAKEVMTTGNTAQFVNLTFTDVVQQWADGAPNFGFAIYALSGDTYRKFYSREYGTSTYRPKLLITYTAPVDVTTYGADGSDENDDTAAFQAAINAADAGGGVVEVPAGDYYLGGINIARSNLVLEGAGTSTVLLPASPDQPYMIHIGSESTSVGYVTVKDLYVRLPAKGNGITIGGAGGSSAAITLTGLCLGGGADSSETSAISCEAGFSTIYIQNNDLSGVTAVPLAMADTATGITVAGNSMPYQPYVAELVQGSDRYDTAVRMAKTAYPDGASAVVLCPGEPFASANITMSAAPLAKAYGGALLLTPTTGLDSRVQAELQRLSPSTVFVIGLSDTIRSAVAGVLPSATVTRLAGSTVYDTAALVAAQVKSKLGTPSRVILVPSDDASGLTVASLAAKKGWPVLFTPKYGPIPDATYNSYVSLGATGVIEVGSTVTRSGMTMVQILNGADVYETAALVADYALTQGCTYAHTGLATWQPYADAFVVGAYVARDFGIVLLTNGSTMPAVTKNRLETHYAALDVLTYSSLKPLWAPDQNAGVWVPTAPRHTTYDLGDFAEHSAGSLHHRSGHRLLRTRGRS
jgi:hypothetical protein